MPDALSFLLGLFLKAGLALVAVNEIRGLILAGPVIYGIYQSGGTWIAIWVGICSLSGIALSVLVPLIAMRKLQKRSALRRAAA